MDKDATVALMADGRVTHAVAEERLSRQKMHAGFPYQALEMVLDLAGLAPSDVDHVAYAFFDADKERALMRKNLSSDFWLNRQKKGGSTGALIREALGRVTDRDLHIPGLKHPLEKMQKHWFKRAVYKLSVSDGLVGDLLNHWQFRRWVKNAARDHRHYQEELVAGLRQFDLDGKLCRFDHHEAHAANAFSCSGFEKALVVTIDAYGSGLSGTVSLADEEGIRRIDQIETPYSLGVMYEIVTSALGFRPDRHAGKIVGLAAYGDPGVLTDLLRGFFVWDGQGLRMRRSSDVYLARHLSTIFPKIDVAAAYQTVLEEVVQRYVQQHVERTGQDTVVLSGGVTANVKLNQRIHEIPGVRNVYVHPGMGDGGCAVGAAALKAVEHGVRPGRMETAFLGPEYSKKEMESALEAAGLEWSYHENIETEIAGLIAHNRVVARFNGRMEYGPRALGNRSILYPAQEPEVNQWLNTRLGRTEFMPFAPATLDEARNECYEKMAGAEFTAQFMTITFDCTPEMQRDCPAAVHVDGTARPQLVTPTSNPSFYRIISEYRRITGIPSIINTSYNMHEEPIVCTPEDAVRAFQKGRLDYLAMGNFLVESDRVQEAEHGGGESIGVEQSATR